MRRRFLLERFRKRLKHLKQSVKNETKTAAILTLNLIPAFAKLSPFQPVSKRIFSMRFIAVSCGAAFRILIVILFSSNCSAETQYYRETIIKEDEFVYLALPFERQEPKGICMAAAALNVLKYQNPDLPLTQSELFKILNDKREGATIPQLIGATKNLGYQCTGVALKKVRYECPEVVFKSLPDTIAYIKSALNDNAPLIGITPRHALTIIGYNEQKKTIIIWDQARGQLPYPLKESDIPQMLSYVLKLEKVEEVTEVDVPTMEAIKLVVENADALTKHTLTNANEREPFNRYLEHALPQAIKVNTRNNRFVILPKSTGGFFLVNPQALTVDAMSVKAVDTKTKKENKYTLQEIIKELLPRKANQLAFYSSNAVKS